MFASMLNAGRYPLWLTFPFSVARATGMHQGERKCSRGKSKNARISNEGVLGSEPLGSARNVISVCVGLGGLSLTALTVSKMETQDGKPAVPPVDPLTYLLGLSRKARHRFYVNEDWWVNQKDPDAWLMAIGRVKARDNAEARARRKAKKLASRGQLLIVANEEVVPVTPNIGPIFAVHGEPTSSWPGRLQLPEFSGRDHSQVAKFLGDLEAFAGELRFTEVDFVTHIVPMALTANAQRWWHSQGGFKGWIPFKRALLLGFPPYYLDGPMDKTEKTRIIINYRNLLSTLQTPPTRSRLDIENARVVSPRQVVVPDQVSGNSVTGGSL